MDHLDTLGLRDKHIIIVGGTGVNGRAMVAQFLALGARVSIVGRDREKLRFLKKQYADKHVRCISGDVCRLQDMTLSFRQLIAEVGKIDVCVNNAVRLSLGRIDSMNTEEWNAVMNTNIVGLSNVAKMVIPHMKENGGGSFITISSQSIINGAPYPGINYITSKGGVVAFTRALAHEVGAYNVRVNCILPGIILSERTESFVKLPDVLQLINRSSLRRAGSPNEVASVCVFLASQLSSYMTGQTIAVNGGLPSLYTL